MPALEGEVVLITGGASGLGRAIAERCVEEGAHVAILDRMVEAACGLSSSVLAIQGDVRSFADNARAVETCFDRFGKLDCAIGNAGIWDYSVPLDDIAADRIDAAFDELFHVNVKGYLHLAKAALPALVATAGSLIFTVSNAGLTSAGGGPLYTASKHAVVGLIRQLAYEFAPAVRVNGVAPGPIETDLRGPGALGLSETSISSIGMSNHAASFFPLGIVPAAADYAGAYVFLTSRRDSRPATGGIVNLDTGIGVRGLGRVQAGDHLQAKYGRFGEEGAI